MSPVKLNVRTAKRTEFVDITAQVRRVVGDSHISNGVCRVFVPHTTAGVTINEAADPSVRRDINSELARMVPFQSDYEHAEGNSAAHIKASLVGSSVTVFVENGDLLLGTWQGIYLCEFDGARSRQVWCKVSDT